MSDSGAPASTSAADDGERPRRRVRVGERRGVHDDAGHQLRRRALRRPRRAARRAGPRAARSSRRSRPPPGRSSRPAPAVAVRRVVVDDDPRQRARTAPDGARRRRRSDRACRSPTRRAGRSRRRAPGRSGPARRRARSRRAAGSGRRRPASRSRRSASTRRQIARVEPSVSASGFSWPTASTRRAARIRSTTAVGDGGEPGREVDHRGGFFEPPRRGPDDGGPWRRRRGLAGLPRRHARQGRHVVRVALVRQPRDRRRERLADRRHVLGRSRPASSSLRSWRTRVPRSRVSSSSRWNSGIRFMRSRLPSSCRTNGIARPIAASVAFRSLGLADDADRHLGVAEIRRRLDVGDRGEPNPRVVDLAPDDLADLLAQQLVDLDPFAASSVPARRCRPATAQAVATRLTVCDEKHSMMSPSSRSWKFARPMPHS